MEETSFMGKCCCDTWGLNFFDLLVYTYCFWFLDDIFSISHHYPHCWISNYENTGSLMQHFCQCFSWYCILNSFIDTTNEHVGECFFSPWTLSTLSTLTSCILFFRSSARMRNTWSAYGDTTPILPSSSLPQATGHFFRNSSTRSTISNTWGGKVRAGDDNLAPASYHPARLNEKLHIFLVKWPTDLISHRSLMLAL